MTWFPPRTNPPPPEIDRGGIVNYRTGEGIYWDRDRQGNKVFNGVKKQSFWQGLRESLFPKK